MYQETKNKSRTKQEYSIVHQVISLLQQLGLKQCLQVTAAIVAILSGFLLVAVFVCGVTYASVVLIMDTWSHSHILTNTPQQEEKQRNISGDFSKNYSALIEETPAESLQTHLTPHFGSLNSKDAAPRTTTYSRIVQ
jgi:hypothetical protein